MQNEEPGESSLIAETQNYDDSSVKQKAVSLAGSFKKAPTNTYLRYRGQEQHDYSAVEQELELQQRLDALRIKDGELKFWSKIFLTLITISLLAWQNWYIFSFIEKAYQDAPKFLKELQILIKHSSYRKLS